jgi:hypothetical protein
MGIETAPPHLQLNSIEGISLKSAENSVCAVMIADYIPHPWMLRAGGLIACPFAKSLFTSASFFQSGDSLF